MLGSGGEGEGEGEGTEGLPASSTDNRSNWLLSSWCSSPRSHSRVLMIADLNAMLGSRKRCRNAVWLEILSGFFTNEGLAPLGPPRIGLRFAVLEIRLLRVLEMRVI
jgi:hypothetical protein